MFGIRVRSSATLVCRHRLVAGVVPMLVTTRGTSDSQSKSLHPLYSDRIHRDLTETEMVSAYPLQQPNETEEAEPLGDNIKAAPHPTATSSDVASSALSAPIVSADGYAEPLSVGMSSAVPNEPYRVSWYTRGDVRPAKRFVYWGFRRLRELPPEWREYYRRMLRQEVKAARFVGQTWDAFMMVVDGYRKGKWVLRKFGIEADPSLIPRPYNNFWEETTHEERVWAHRRSTQMKELQALQRDEDSLVFGAVSVDQREFAMTSLNNLSGGGQGGTPVHALDLGAPSEEEIKMSRHHEEMSSALMGAVEDDKLWNPVLKARLHKQKMRNDAASLAFEDDDDDANDPSTAGNVVPARFSRGEDSA